MVQSIGQVYVRLKSLILLEGMLKILRPKPVVLISSPIFTTFITYALLHVI